MNSTDKSGIYIHIPFCVKKCKYCDFLSYGNPLCLDDYVEALIREINSFHYDDIVDSVFLGGGTPTLLNASQIANIMEAVYRRFTIYHDCEITMEGNPGTITPDRIKEYALAGINRFSMGIQSLNNRELEILGRIHSEDEALKCYDYIRNAGIDNINVDIMSGIPEQTLDSYQRTLEKIVELKPEHISSYSLIIEEGTPFYEMYEKGELQLPDEDTEREMYYLTERILIENDYTRYEISNYSRPMRESRHNIKYWKRNEYVGFGLGASSLVNNRRYSNTTDMRKYIEKAGRMDIRENFQNLSEKDKIEEYMYLGLRMMEGIDINDFEATFGKNIYEIYGNIINRFIEEKLMISEGLRLKLTPRGIDVSNMVLAEFLLDIF